MICAHFNLSRLTELIAGGGNTNHDGAHLVSRSIGTTNGQHLGLYSSRLKRFILLFFYSS